MALGHSVPFAPETWLRGLTGEIGSGGRGYPGADTVVEGSVAVWAVGYGWGEQGGGEDGGVCEGCGEGVREADGGQGEAGEGSVGLGNVVSGICGCHNPRGLDFFYPKTLPQGP